jgi:tetratricopeptide (TPR) repeat protein
LKRETIITAMVFLVVGFFIGYITEAEFNWNAPERMAPAAAAAAPAGASGAGTQNTAAGGAGNAQLPPGHPPLEIAGKIQELEDQAAQHPEDPAPRLELANLYYDQRVFDRAAEWYEKELALDPKNASARTDLGTAYFNLGRPQDALKEYEATLKINPTHEPTMFNMIIVNLQGTHDLAAARAAWEKLHQRNPNYPGLDKLKEELDAGGGG